MGGMEEIQSGIPLGLALGYSKMIKNVGTI